MVTYILINKQNLELFWQPLFQNLFGTIECHKSSHSTEKYLRNVSLSTKEKEAKKS